MRPLGKIERVVVKIGSRLIAENVDERVGILAREVAALKRRNIESVIVTSGAIALGMRRLQLSERPRTMPGLQAAAAIGQGHLILAYERALEQEGLLAGQVLLTHDDVRDRKRYLNARHTLAELLRMGAVPVINENDTVSVDEIKFGDNDRLAALVTSLCEADLLIILTDVAGLYNGPPETSQLISDVRDIDAEAMPFAQGSGSMIGTGGMLSKVQAAKTAGRFGVITMIASGRRPSPVQTLVDGAAEGTVFWPSVSRLQSRKHWIAYALKPLGVLVVDEGAKRALIEGKKSLLPSGIKRVEGHFSSGDPVAVRAEAGDEIARGLCAFDDREVALIMGKKSSELEAIVGYRCTEEVIHRDDLVPL